MDSRDLQGKHHPQLDGRNFPPIDVFEHKNLLDIKNQYSWACAERESRLGCC